jgi:pimeloyl-ACP methyl ester carboxylesterase
MDSGLHDEIQCRWGSTSAISAPVRPPSCSTAIAGADDRAQPPPNAARIAGAAPRGELLVIEGAGHFPFAETPDRYWPPLIDWLKRA